MPTKPKPKTVRFVLRLPAELHAVMVKQAALDNRSLNGQIVHILQAAAIPRKP